MTRRRLLLISAALFLVVAGGITLYVLRQRTPRHRVFRGRHAQTAPPAAIPPLEQWTTTFQSLAPAALDELLSRIEATHPDLYARYSLGYLQARARIEANDSRGAEARLAPFLAAANPLHDLALYHQSEVDDALGESAKASRARQELIFGSPTSPYRQQSIEEETEALASQNTSAALLAFATRLEATAPRELRRDLESHLAESLARQGNLGGARTRAFAILGQGTMDDAADRAARSIDRPELIRTMNARELVLLGTAMQNHRHFDRAVAILALALNATAKRQAAEGIFAPSNPEAGTTTRTDHAVIAAAMARTAAKPRKKPVPVKRPAPRPASKTSSPPAPATSHDDLIFAIGRSQFGEEKYEDALQTYRRGAAEATDAKWRATFLFHASRAAQLAGNDALTEQLMTAAIAVPGHWPATTAALTQRIRTRVRQRRIADAATDLALLRKIAPNDHAAVEGALTYALAMIAYGNPRAAISALNTVPPALLTKLDQPEFAYWRARALETIDAHAAFASYLAVLRSPVPTHFAYFARDRLDSAAMAPRLAAELTQRDAEVEKLIAAHDFERARARATDRVLLSSRDRARQLARLASIYRELPAYRAILELKPLEIPAIPHLANNRLDTLLGLGLFDEAADEIPRRWPLHPLANALTQSLALNRGGASKPSIYAIEVLMKSVPDDYYPALLPLVVRQLLYPRYFFGTIEADSKKFDADPTLVLSIMREESRFDPRAKSEAAARGLLQFIITTAQEIGREIGLVDVSADDLYDPRVIIRLGARYIGELLAQFGGNPYKTAAAYNAGPKQVQLWSRLAPAAGDDFFLSSINFDETKDYVRKVMNSYKRYEETYGSAPPQGGLRAEP